MYEAKDLAQEIGKKIEMMRAQNNAVLNPEWIAQAVLTDHRKIKGSDKPFFSYNAHANVRNEVRKQLNQFKLKPGEAADRQLVLPGFERVQQYYLVTREEVQCAVHVDSLSEEEYEAKLAELHAMAQGCIKHAEELERYWKTKRAA